MFDAFSIHLPRREIETIRGIVTVDPVLFSLIRERTTFLHARDKQLRVPARTATLQFVVHERVSRVLYRD